MSDDAIRKILEDLLESGGQPEDHCAHAPGLLPEVRRRWREVASTSAAVDALFPSTGRRPAPQEIQIPPRIPGYEDPEYVGRGGMGVVYRARHAALGRPVALKMLLPGVHGPPEETEALLREASSVASLRHPNIVQVFDVGTFEGRPYFTMEFLDGGSLIERSGGVPQPPREAAALLATLADAVQAAHDGGVVHRDLKPGNILFTAGGTPKVADFSLARRIAGDPGATLAPAAVGTPSFMAPEQALAGSGRCAPAVDVYALGAVLYDLLTGRPPFRADTPCETHRQVIQEDPAPPSRLNARIPRDLETICLTCLRKEPGRRYDSARSLADDLRRFLDGRPITARRTGPVERTLKWARRRPAPAALLLVAATAAILAVGVGAWIGSDRTARAAAVHADVARAVQLQAEGRYAEARRVLELARARLGAGGPRSARHELDAAGRDDELAEKLDAVRMDRAASANIRFDRGAFGSRYQKLLADAGIILGTPGVPDQASAERIRSSPIKLALLCALNDWAYCSTDKGDLQRKLELARLADPHPWRDKLRTPWQWENAQVLRELAETAPADVQTPTLTPILAGLLMSTGQDPIDLLRRVQADSPSDFWANFNLADYLGAASRQDAVGFYRAALAVRPDSLAALVNLGIELAAQAQEDEADDCWRRALKLNPNCAPALANLGADAYRDRRLPEAWDLLSRAAAADPLWEFPPLILGEVRSLAGRPDEAIPYAETAVSLIPPGTPRRADAERVLERNRRLVKIAGRLDHYTSSEPDLQDLQGVSDAAAVLYGRGRAEDALRLTRWLLHVAETGQVEIEKDNLTEVRALAARAAAQAAAAPDAPETRRGELAADAINWLRTDLEELRANPDPIARRRNARQWLRTPELGPIRNVAGLNALPPEQAEACRAFWEQVRQTEAPASPATLTPETPR